MLVSFDSKGFRSKCLLRIRDEAPSDVIRNTGIPTPTFYRMLDGQPLERIDHILSLAAYLDIEIEHFIGRG